MGFSKGLTKRAFAGLFARVFKGLFELHKEGASEYAHASDSPFDNFMRIADLTGHSREAVLLVYFLKHVDGIASYVKGHRSQREDVRGRIRDAIVYLVLLYGMVEEDDLMESDIEELERAGEALENGSAILDPDASVQEIIEQLLSDVGKDEVRIIVDDIAGLSESP